MAPAFLAKGMKCVNAAPARGESACCTHTHTHARLQRGFLFLRLVIFLLFVVSLSTGSGFLFFFFGDFLCVRNGEGHFKHWGKQPECEEAKDPLGQKYRLRERYLRHQREKGHLPVKPSAPGIHSGIFKGKHSAIRCLSSLPVI